MDIDELKEYIKIAKKEKFRRLNLANKELETLPDEFMQLTNLRFVDLSYNSFEEFPRALTRLPQLKTVLLFRNKINTVTNEIGNLSQLELLDLSYNKLTALPEAIGNLFNLKTLDLGYNQLKSLPLEFVNLTSLRKLYLENNAFEYPPDKVIKRGLYATMHFLFGEMRKKESSRVILQVYNLPQTIQRPFKEYLNYFNDMISSVNKHEINFDIKFIRHDIMEELDLEHDVENYLQDFLLYIKSNLNDLKKIKPELGKNSDFIDLQIIELRKHIGDLKESLSQRAGEIEDLMKKIENLNYLLDLRANR